MFISFFSLKAFVVIRTSRVTWRLSSMYTSLLKLIERPNLARFRTEMNTLLEDMEGCDYLCERSKISRRYMSSRDEAYPSELVALIVG